MQRRGPHFRYAAILFIIVVWVAGSSTAWAQLPPTHPAATVDYGTGVGKKLGRGVANVAFGWIDIFKGIQEVAEQNNVIAGLTWGPIYGTGKAVVRTLAGAYEVVTFPIPWPADFEPLVQPEFVMEGDR